MFLSLHQVARKLQSFPIAYALSEIQLEQFKSFGFVACEIALFQTRNNFRSATF